MSNTSSDLEIDVPAPRSAEEVPNSPPGEETATPDPQAELASARDRLLRLAADFDNFKKRTARDRDEARRLGVESVIGKLLPVLDNFDMAMSAANQTNTTLETLRIGVNMIHGQFRNLFTDLGVKEVDALGQRFDPTRHEAVSMEPAPGVPDGQVTQQLRKGYQLGDRLLRPASVVVAAPPTENTNPS